MTHVILKGVVGSQAYNLATPESDIDYMGVFVLPTREILSLRRARDNFETITPTQDTKLYEIGKFLGMALSMNPHVTEFLWLDEYVERNKLGTDLTLLRTAFLSNKAKSAYYGYARGELSQLLKRGDFGSDLKKRQAKHGRHIYRLLIQGLELLQTGKLTVRLSDEDRQKCFEAGELALKDVDKYAKMMEARLALYDEVKSVLPDEPQFDVIDDFLYTVRLNSMFGDYG